MQLQRLGVLERLHGSIALLAGERDLDRVVEEVEAVGLVDSLQSSLGAVVDDEGLALGLEVGLCDDLEDVSEFGEDGV